jgi:hypothetical protein
MLGGTALCVTSLILAWRVIGAYFLTGGVQRLISHPPPA